MAEIFAWIIWSFSTLYSVRANSIDWYGYSLRLIYLSSFLVISHVPSHTRISGLSTPVICLRRLSLSTLLYTVAPLFDTILNFSFTQDGITSLRYSPLLSVNRKISLLSLTSRMRLFLSQFSELTQVLFFHFVAKNNTNKISN